MQPTILITGGGGFIGNWVVREALDRGLRVVVFDVGDRPPRWQRVLGVRAAAVPLVRGNLLDRELLGRVLDEHHVTHVIHLAALLTPGCQQDPFEGARVNVLGSVALFEEVRTRAEGYRQRHEAHQAREAGRSARRHAHLAGHTPASARP